MQFVEKHLTTHHLLHAPHRWFFAVLLSPVHAAERHYMRRYHLRFAHAKKLFFFDLCLVGCIFFLFASTLFWHFYDPTIRDLVSIKVEQTTDRIASGEKISYSVSYNNRSDLALDNTLLTFALPKGFIFESITPEFQNIFQKEKETLSLGELAPGANGTFTLVGTIVGSPEQLYDTVVKMSYTPEKSTDSEYVIARLITTPQVAPLMITLSGADVVLSQGSLPFQIIVENKGATTLRDIHIPLPANPNITLSDMRSNSGTITDTWNLTEIPAHTSSTFTGTILTKLPTEIQTFTLETTPAIWANGSVFPQAKISKDITVIHPHISAQAHFQNAVAKPGESVVLELTLKNESTVALQNVEILIPITGEINKSKLSAQKNGTIRGAHFVLNKNFDARLTELGPHETATVSVPIPLALHQAGTDATLTLSPEIQATLLLIPGSIFSEKASAASLKIASDIALTGTVRYFTIEGDQLGIGPLPPKVGKQTRYMTSLVLQNTTGEVQNVQLQASLAPGIVWGDKSSVSFGKDLLFDPNTKTLTWSAGLLPAHTIVGINFAVLFTPSTAQIGGSANLVQNIQVTALDTVTQLPISTKISNLDSSLPQDLRAQNIGVKVME